MGYVEKGAPRLFECLVFAKICDSQTERINRNEIVRDVGLKGGWLSVAPNDGRKQTSPEYFQVIFYALRIRKGEELTASVFGAVAGDARNS